MDRKQLNIQNYIINKSGSVTINNFPEESKDIALQVRVTPSQADRIDTFCAGRKITRSDYLRHLSTLTPELFDYIEILNKEIKNIKPLLNRLAE